ncbi:hypothetical protein [Pseudomonas sp.]|uniref:hypothetical protein n=1 Tax=Pseudomonas sp. TaxID=306 RepID=UPI003C78869A
MQPGDGEPLVGRALRKSVDAGDGYLLLVISMKVKSEAQAMDPKNLAVLQKLKDSMSSTTKEDRSLPSSEDLLRRLSEAHLNLIGADEEEAKRASKKAGRTHNSSSSHLPGGGSRNKKEKAKLTGKVWRVDQSNRNEEFRGVQVSKEHYKALVDAASGRLNGNRTIKLEALAFYLEKSPGDQGAMNLFARIYGSNDPEALAKVRHSALNRGIPKPIHADTTAYGLCAGCGERLLVDQNRRRNTPVLCGSCKDAERNRSMKALINVKSDSVAGKKIAKLEEAIERLQKQIAEHEAGDCPSGLRLSLLKLEAALDKERIHAVSGLSQIRCKFVSGSYGAGKRR